MSNPRNLRDADALKQQRQQQHAGDNTRAAKLRHPQTYCFENDFKQFDRETRDKFTEIGDRTFEALTAIRIPRSGPMTAEEAEEMLISCSRFLDRLVQLVGGVAETVDADAVRRLTASDVPLPYLMRAGYKAAGLDTSTKPVRDPSPQKRPRAARHPLLALLSLGAQAARLLDRITRSLFPEVHQQESLEEKQARKKGRSSLMDCPSPG
jgi:hypothetical protein